MAFLFSKSLKSLLVAAFVVGFFVAGLPALSHAGPVNIRAQMGLSQMDLTDDFTFSFSNNEVISHKRVNQVEKSRAKSQAVNYQTVPFKSIALRNAQVQMNAEPSRAGVIKAENGIRVNDKTVVFDRQSKYKIDKELGKAKTLLSFKSKFGTMGGSPRGYYIMGRIYADFNQNGMYDLGESGVPNVLVEINNVKKGKLGQVTTDANGLFDTRALSASSFATHEFIVPENTEQLSKPYSNEILASYFDFIQAPEGYDYAEVVLGFALDLDALLADLDSGTVSTNGQTPDQWAAKLSAWTRPYVWNINGLEISGLEVLKNDSPDLNAQLSKELLTLELNLRSRVGLSSSDAAMLDLQNILVEYGHFLLNQATPDTKAERTKALQIFRIINGG